MNFDCFQVLARNVPTDPDESVSELVEHFFLVNHPDHYLTHQVGSLFIYFFIRNSISLIKSRGARNFSIQGIYKKTLI
jgi:hypothetical protein